MLQRVNATHYTYNEGGFLKVGDDKGVYLQSQGLNCRIKYSYVMQIIFLSVNISQIIILVCQCLLPHSGEQHACLAEQLLSLLPAFSHQGGIIGSQVPGVSPFTYSFCQFSYSDLFSPVFLTLLQIYPRSVEECVPSESVCSNSNPQYLRM